MRSPERRHPRRSAPGVTAASACGSTRRPALQSHDPATGRHTAQRLPETLLVGAIALREAGGFVLATNHGLYFYDPPAACRRKPSSTPKATSPATA